MGPLEMRVAATRALNIALASACDGASYDAHGVHILFSGVDTWDFAAVSGEPPPPPPPPLSSSSPAMCSISCPGSLRGDISDGHVHVRADMCSPVHDRVRAIITGFLLMSMKLKQNIEERAISMGCL